MNWKTATVLKLLTILDLVQVQYWSVTSEIWSGHSLLYCELWLKFQDKSIIISITINYAHIAARSEF